MNIISTHFQATLNVASVEYLKSLMGSEFNQVFTEQQRDASWNDYTVFNINESALKDADHVWLDASDRIVVIGYHNPITTRRF